MSKYYTPEWDEFKPGFKCQSCFWYFEDDTDNYTIDEDDKYKIKWYNVKFTEELYNHTISLIKADGYRTEFRVEK